MMLRSRPSNNSFRTFNSDTSTSVHRINFTYAETNYTYLSKTRAVILGQLNVARMIIDRLPGIPGKSQMRLQHGSPQIFTYRVQWTVKREREQKERGSNYRVPFWDVDRHREPWWRSERSGLFALCSLRGSPGERAEAYDLYPEEAGGRRH